MKILLPNGSQETLDENLTFEEKLELVNKLTNEWMPIVWRDWRTWKTDSVKYFLDSLSNYLVWHKEDREEGKKGKEDKEILSRKKLEKMNTVKSTSKQINFSDLPKETKELLFGEGDIA